MDKPLTTDEVAEMLHCSTKTLQRWRDEGIGPAYTRSGRRYLYSPADVEAYLAGNRVATS